MKVHFITIVLDGMPFITWHYPMLRTLKIDWHWWVVEGVALPKQCTGWVAEIPPRLSADGTAGYLKETSDFDDRVTYISSPFWNGKVSMFNDALDRIEDDQYLLWELDSDEIWSRNQIEKAVELVSQPQFNCAYFRCRYFVGSNIAITSRDGFGNHTAYEWRRLWKVRKGASFLTHEPPILKDFTECPATHDVTEYFGLVFDHYAYATEKQMRFKQEYYAGPKNPCAGLYRNAVTGWLELQKATLPVPQLNKYLPWVGDNVEVDLIQCVK